jgi:hypothetical protein
VDAQVIGGDDDARDARAHARALDDMLDKRPACQRRERLSGEA